MYPNKIRAERYPSLEQISNSLREKSNSLVKKISHSYAVTVLNQKESHIDMIKRRISALCVKDEKVTHRTVNNQMRWQQKFKIKEQSSQIKALLQKQRKREAQNLQELKNRNIKSRMEDYYRAKTFRKEQLETKKQYTNIERTKSRQNDRMIIKHREQTIQQKRHKKQQINKSEHYAKSERSRILFERQKSVQQQQKRQVQHLLNLGSIKDAQINKLGELELMMVQRNTSSRMAYQASIQRLKNTPKRRSGNSYYQPNKVIRNVLGKSSRVNHSLHD